MDFSPIYKFINTLKKKFFINDQQLRHLKIDYSNYVVDTTYSFLLATKRSKDKFESEFVILIEPHENFHSGNVFHETLLKILKIIAGTSEKILIGPRLFPKDKCFFFKDKIHLSDLGEKKLYNMVRSSVNILARNLSVDKDNIDNAMSELRVFCAEKAPDNSCTHDVCRFGPRDGVDHHFDKLTYYRAQPSNKLLGLWSPPTKLSNLGKFPLAHLHKDHLLIWHGTSLFRCFICKKYQNRIKRANSVLFPIPATITISPGSTAALLSKDIHESSELQSLNITAFISVIYFGSNEKSHFANIMSAHLCDQNLLTGKECTICEHLHRNNKVKKGLHCTDDSFNS